MEPGSEGLPNEEKEVPDLSVIVTNCTTLSHSTAMNTECGDTRAFLVSDPFTKKKPMAFQARTGRLQLLWEFSIL